MPRKKVRKERVFLTPEDIETMMDELVAENGRNVKAVADKYDITIATVYFHMRHRLDKVYRKKERQLELRLGNGPCLDKDT